MNNSNFCHFFGRVGNDIEVTDHNGFKTTNKFTLFVSRNYKNKQGEYESDKIQCQATNKTAEYLANNYGKGDSISVSGAMRTDDYTDKDGNPRISVYLSIENVDPIISKKKNGNNSTPAPAANVNSTTANAEQDELGEEIEHDDLPF